MISPPEGIIDSEREESRAARDQDLPDDGFRRGPHGDYWVPTWREADEDERRRERLAALRDGAEF